MRTEPPLVGDDEDPAAAAEDPAAPSSPTA